MTKDIEIIAWGGKRNVDIWRLITGCEIIHTNGKKFKIIRIKKGRYLYLLSEEQGTNHTYHLDSFSSNFCELLITDNNQELIDTIIKLKKERDFEIKKETERRLQEEYINKLRIKYGIQHIVNVTLLQWVDEIILRLENGKILNKNEEKQLFKEGFIKILAIFHENNIDSDKQHIPQAAKYWRILGFPERALSLTNIEINNNNKLMSSILTSRGGAFRDLEKYMDAEQCGLAALEYDDRGCCPYNLLGAIYVETDNLTKGRDFFEIAKEKKGYNPEDQTKTLRKILQKVKQNKNKERQIKEYFNDYF